MNLRQGYSHWTLLLLALGAIAAPNVDAEENLLTNPSFENGLAGWETQGSVSVVPGGLSGDWCARITSTHVNEIENDAECKQTVSGAQGTKYTLRFWARATPRGSASYVFSRLLYGQSMIGISDISGEWTQYTMSAFVEPDNFGAEAVQVIFTCIAGTERDTLTLNVDDVVLTASAGVPCCYPGPWCTTVADTAACLAYGHPVKACADCVPGACCFGDRCVGTFTRPQCLAAGGEWLGPSCQREVYPGEFYGCEVACSFSSVEHPELETDTTTTWEVRYHLPSISECCQMITTEMCLEIYPCPGLDPDPPRVQCVETGYPGGKGILCFPIDRTGGSLMITAKKQTFYQLHVPEVTWTCGACPVPGPDGLCAGGRAEWLPPYQPPVRALKTTWGQVKSLYR
jgi:hypothetical protein